MEILRVVERLKSKENWRVVRLKDVVETRREIVNPRQLDPSTPYAYVGLEHIMPGELLLRRFGKAASVKSPKLRFYKGNILYGRLRPYLDKVVVATINGICSTDIIVLNVKAEYVMPALLVLVLHSTRFIRHATKTMRGTDRPRVTWSSLADFTLTLPPLGEQKEITDILFTFEKLRDLYSKQLEKLDRIKRGLTDLILSS